MFTASTISQESKKVDPTEFKTLDEFIDFYKEIPSRKWTAHDFSYGGQYCAVGHLGIKSWSFTIKQKRMLKRLTKLTHGSTTVFKYPTNLVDVNNGNNRKYSQRSPRSRVLAYLKDIKKENEKAGRKN